MNQHITVKKTYTVKCTCGAKKYGIDRDKTWTCECGQVWKFDGAAAVVVQLGKGE